MRRSRRCGDVEARWGLEGSSGAAGGGLVEEGRQRESDVAIWRREQQQGKKTSPCFFLTLVDADVVTATTYRQQELRQRTPLYVVMGG